MDSSCRERFQRALNRSRQTSGTLCVPTSTTDPLWVKPDTFQGISLRGFMRPVVRRPGHRGDQTLSKFF